MLPRSQVRSENTRAISGHLGLRPEIIDPGPLLCEFMDMGQGILNTELEPGSGPTYRP